MSASNQYLYCSQCGLKLIKALKFCTTCGAKIKTVFEEKRSESDSSGSTKSFNDYFDLKSNEKTRFFKHKKNRKERG